MTKELFVRALIAGCCVFLVQVANAQGQEDDLDALLQIDGSESGQNGSTVDEAVTAGDESGSEPGNKQADSEITSGKTTEEATDKPKKKRGGSRVIEEIVVTAQKREEDVQDVPIMINAFSGDKLDAFGIQNTEDLQRITPGLTYTYTYGYSVIYMRGVGTDAFLPNADPSVATYIDGVNITPSQGKQDTLGPVDRVEVLKGPQGTLFGRNATGGAINIVTADPPDEFEGSLKADFGNYNSRKYQMYLASPITDFMGATLALYRETGDLYGRNEVSGRAGPMKENYVEGGRFKLKTYFSDNLSLTLWTAQSNQFNSNSLSQENTRPAPLFDGGVEPDPDDPDRVWHNNYLGGNETTNVMYAGTLEWNTEFGDLKLIYSDNKADVDEAQMDYDSTETSQATFYSNDQYNYQKTYEIQFVSAPTDNLKWVGGLYRLEGEGGFGALYFTVNGLGFGNNVLGVTNLLNDIGALLPTLGLGGLGNTVNDFINSTPDIVLGNGGLLATESNAAYLQGTWTATDWLDITLGARYQIEKRDLFNSYLDLVLPTAGSPPNDYFDRGDTSQNVRIFDFDAPQLEDKTLSPKLALQFRPGDGNIQYFFSAQRAYKSPTYNIVNFFTSPDAVERETATAYEIGFKSDLLNGALRLNAAAFYTKIDGLLTAIVSLGSGGIVTFRNAGEAEIKGLEFDTLWQPMPEMNPGLAISAGATYLKGIYTDYKDGAGYDDDTGLYFGDDSLTGSPARDFTGNDIVRTPDLTANISMNQAVDVGRSSSMEFGLDYYYNSGFNTTPQNSPHYEQPAYDLWSGRIAYFYHPWGLQLTAYVDNALDEEYVQAMLQQDFGRTVTLAPPRTFGLRVKWDF